jgi:hypothetical protein
MRRGPTGVSETGPAAAPFCFQETNPFPRVLSLEQKTPPERGFSEAAGQGFEP